MDASETIPKDSSEPTKVILVLKCRDCGTELNRSDRPLTEEQARQARLNSAFAAGPCPKGCRSTFSDLNINTIIEEIPA